MKNVINDGISMYCKNCKLFDTCQKSKTCSCELFDPVEIISNKKSNRSTSN